MAAYEHLFLPNELKLPGGNELVVLPFAFSRDIIATERKRARVMRGDVDRILLLKGEYDGPAISSVPFISLNR